jgi:hypothetical protein
MSTEQMRVKGSVIVLAAAATALVLAALSLAIAGTGQQGAVAGLRATAVLSVPFLVGAYAAPAVGALWPGKLGEWLLLRGRVLGLAFSAVIAVHLVLILRLLSLPPSPRPTLLGLTPGFLTYLVLAGMTLSSFSRLAKTLGADRVRFLRRMGGHWVFAIVTLGLARAVFLRHSLLLYVAPLMAVTAAYALRFAAWRRSSPRWRSLDSRRIRG